MKLHHPLHLFALLLMPLVLGYLLRGIQTDYHALGHTRWSNLFLFAGTAAGLLAVVALVFKKSPFDDTAG